ncbi:MULTISPECIES: glycosyltransferase family 2 protein [Winogradskyella]|uniref:glycosyltransferase family 2 protein n=1 Tax=Winogradskyella TaxID=286104 RepID=UPI0015CA3606|nr:MULTISPECIES: glycosyltransferase family 2 protein [Winogradskyella]QXP78207.1 glycosyltransferase family 2 protein [Winogradskyella sp. HaHa_3_26]
MLEKEPLVSIIIPTFNRAHLIGETLDSVLAQTYLNWECIVVDDGSTDSTDQLMATYVAKDSRFQYYHRPDDRLPGGNAARNYGFELSIGEYVNWFDSDDLMHPKKLEKQVDSLKGNDYILSVCQTLVFQGVKENILGLRSDKIYTENALSDFITAKIQFLTQAPLIRKSFLVEKKLIFDEELKAAQEWEFICRLLYFSTNYISIDVPLVYYRKNQKSISYGNIPLRNYHYYLARVKFYYFLKGLPHKEQSFLLKHLFNYILSKYLNFLRSMNVKFALSIFTNFIVFNTSLLHSLSIALLSPITMFTGKTFFVKSKLNKK